MSRIINFVALTGTVVLILSVLASMRGAFPVSFRLVELAAALTVLFAVAANIVISARHRRNRS